MKKIIIFSLGRAGGSVNYAREIIDNLACEKKIFTSCFSDERTPKNSVEIITYTSSLFFIISSLVVLPVFLLYIFFLQVFKKFDSLYFPYFHYWNYPIIMLYKVFFRRVNIVSTVHDGISHIGDGKPLEQKLNIACINSSKKIIFLTAYVEDKIKKQINNNLNSYVIPHGLIIPRKIKLDIRKHKDKMNILFLGRVSIYKGVEYLIDAVEGIDIVKYNKLIIAGKQQYKLDNKNNKNIHVVDKFLEEEEMSSIINEADILVLPYIEATQSGVITMGISGCIPMIITRVGGLREQLNKDEALWVNPNSTSEIKDAIEDLITNKIKYETFSLKLQQKQNDLSWKVIAFEILEVL